MHLYKQTTKFAETVVSAYNVLLVVTAYAYVSSAYVARVGSVLSRMLLQVHAKAHVLQVACRATRVVCEEEDCSIRVA